MKKPDGCIRCDAPAAGIRTSTVPWGWRYCAGCLEVRRQQRARAGLESIITEQRTALA